MPTRRQVVQRVLELCPRDLDCEQAERIWFCDVRRTGGWRLTLAGRAAFDKAGLQSWAVPLEPHALDRVQLLAMNRNLKWPYFISNRPLELVLFSDREAVMAQLYGDVRAWISSISK